MNQTYKLKLRADTECFWRNLRDYGSTTSRFIKYYIGDLLQREMSEENLPKKSSECAILVLLVGFSYEPLLQSICYYNPKSVLLVLNEEGYGDQNADEKLMELEELIGELWRKGLISAEPTITHTEAPGKPEKIFRSLCDNLIRELQKSKTIIIDVTGAKKSMVTGAYLFGAYTNTSISYVDFDEYNTKYGRPYGYSHDIGNLKNPYQAFQLRNWEEVKSYYHKYAFRSARQLLEKVIKPAMKTPLENWETSTEEEETDSGLFTPKHIEAVDCFIQVLEIYELWDNGDYQTALEKSRKLPSVLSGFKSPLAVTELGKYWPRGENLLDDIVKLETGDAQTPSLYVRNPDLLVYAKDELEKICRLIEKNQDYRSALIRAVGLEEVLLKARITCLWERKLLEIAERKKSQELKFDAMDKLPNEIKDNLPEIRKEIVLAISMYGVIDALQYDTVNSKSRKLRMKISCQRGQKDERNFFVRRCLNGTQPLDNAIICKEERNLRNKAAHTYLSIPQVTAEKAYEKVKANFEDFVKHWKKYMQQPQTTTVDFNDSRGFEIENWELLCKWCGIHDFLPPIPDEEKEGN